MLRYNRRNRRVRVAVGTIVYIQDGIRPFGRSRYHVTIRRNPWQVESWTPRTIEAGRWVPTSNGAGRWEPCRMAGGHLATVRSLRTGQVRTVADWLLEACIDEP